MNRARVISFAMLLGASGAFLVACVGVLGDFDVEGSDASVDAQTDGAANGTTDAKVAPAHDGAVGAGQDDAQSFPDSSVADAAHVDASNDAAPEVDATSNDASEAGGHDAGPPDAGPHDASPPDAGPPDTGPVGAIWDQSNWNQSLWQ